MKPDLVDAAGLKCECMVGVGGAVRSVGHVMSGAGRHTSPGRSRSERPHEVFAIMNSLNNPWLAAIYLSLVTSTGTAEEVDRARQVIINASTDKD